MFDLLFFKPLIQFIFVVAVLGVEIYGLIRLILRLARIENFSLRIISLLALIPLFPVILYLNFVFLYIVGGGH